MQGNYTLRSVVCFLQFDPKECKKNFMGLPLKVFHKKMIAGFIRFAFSDVFREIREWVRVILMAIPGEIGSLIRTSLMSIQTVGENVRILRGGWIDYPEKLKVGKKTQINRFCLINAGGGVEIGENVLIGPYTIIYSQNHNFSDRSIPINRQSYTKKNVIIEDDVWLAARVMILPGIIVRKGTVVAAGAIVTKDTDPYAIMAGAPAVKIGERSFKARVD